jgi:FMN phosphatase YigB (HAD superfamily)
MPESFELALKLAGNPASNQCAILDDLPRTICAARQAGIFSILVSETAPTAEVAADAVLTNWQQLPSILANA